MSKIIFGLLFSFFLLPAGVGAQENPEEAYRFEKDALSRIRNDRGEGGQITISLDPFIEENYYKHILFNSRRPAIMGWQIRIFSASGLDALDQATRVRAEFLSKYEDVSIYLKWDTPDYKVYVGDCRTRSEALKLFEQIKKDYPYAFLVNKAIQPKKE